MTCEEATAYDAAVRDAAVRDAAVRDAAVRDAAVRDAAVRDAAVRDAAVRDAAVQERMAGEAAASMSFGRYLALVAATAAALVVVGYLPTVRLGGEGAVPAMFAGCAVSVVASLFGSAPLLLIRGRTPADGVNAVLGSIVVRLATVVMLAVAVALGGLFANMPFLLWVAISHAALLVVDTVHALGRLRR